MLIGAHLELARPFSPGPTMVDVQREQSKARKTILPVVVHEFMESMAGTEARITGRNRRGT